MYNSSFVILINNNHGWTTAVGGKFGKHGTIWLISELNDNIIADEKPNRLIVFWNAMISVENRQLNVFTKKKKIDCITLNFFLLHRQVQLTSVKFSCTSAKPKP